MGYVISSILPRAAARLNDYAQTKFTNAALLPYAQDAGDELQLGLGLHGILVLETISAIIPVPANTLRLSEPAGGGISLIPLNMLEPQKLEERLRGSTDLFVEMTRRQWEPAILPTDSLRYWDYREEDIFFVGSTLARDVKISYIKRLINITSLNSVVSVNNSQQFMIDRTAALAARYIGENPTRADQLDKEAENVMLMLIRTGAKSKQGTRTRRRPFTINGRRRWV